MDATRTPADRMHPPEATKATRRLAVWLVLASGLLAVILAPLSLQLVREQLHIRCGMGQPGSEGADTWVCSDGLGYLGVAVAFGTMWFFAVLFGSLVAGVVRVDRTARPLLVLLAAACTAWVLALTHYGASELVYDKYALMKGEEYWAHAVAPAAIVSAVSVTAAVVSLFLRGRLGPIVAASAALGLLIATVLQPGLGVDFVPAAGLLAAMAARSTSSVVDPRRPARR